VKKINGQGKSFRYLLELLRAWQMALLSCTPNYLVMGTIKVLGCYCMIVHHSEANNIWWHQSLSFWHIWLQFHCEFEKVVQSLQCHYVLLTFLAAYCCLVQMWLAGTSFGIRTSMPDPKIGIIKLKPANAPIFLDGNLIMSPKYAAKIWIQI